MELSVLLYAAAPAAYSVGKEGFTFRPLGEAVNLVEPGRIELPTSCVQGRRSPS